ncbi:MAG: translocation/assembly module TamB [Ignavibacteriales bacterium]|nr:translocation/assembly module TamB [Ignavibacteriales bacterium]
MSLFSRILILKRINLNASGSLKILDSRYRAIDPALFGDLTIKTRNDILFTSSEERNYLNADLILAKDASITYSPTQSAFSNESDKFTYVFVSPLVEDVIRKEIDSLIQIADLKEEEMKSETTIPFDFDFKIEVEKEAKVVFVLSREFKQNLTAYLGGKLEYSEINEVPVARGELTLLDGSKLDFIKTFQADGNIKFLDEIDNPYVNVTATYESFYSPDTVSTGTNEWDVQIIIKVEGPAKNITTNFLQDESNVSVYKSRRNANQFELDATKSASDAMFFIIVNKFPEDASLQESNFAASTAASLAGSIVGNVLNEKLGDVMRSVNVQQVGAETKFSLIGKVENFRYEIGGTSQVFQDLSRANVRIEHPLFFPNFIIRFDRKEPPYSIVNLQ